MTSMPLLVLLPPWGCSAATRRSASRAKQLAAFTVKELDTARCRGDSAPLLQLASRVTVRSWQHHFVECFVSNIISCYVLPTTQFLFYGTADASGNLYLAISDADNLGYGINGQIVKVAAPVYTAVSIVVTSALAHPIGQYRHATAGRELPRLHSPLPVP